MERRKDLMKIIVKKLSTDLYLQELNLSTLRITVERPDNLKQLTNINAYRR